MLIEIWHLLNILIKFNYDWNSKHTQQYNVFVLNILFRFGSNWKNNIVLQTKMYRLIDDEK